jgi:hypothetical protein
MQVNRRVSFEELTYLGRFCAERLSAITWISLQRGWFTTRSVRKATSLTEVCVPCHRLDEHFARLGVEPGIQREHVLTVVLEAVSLGAPQRERQHGIKPVEGLVGVLGFRSQHPRTAYRNAQQ